MATLVEAPADVVASLERKVVDSSTSLPDKYRVLFSLRNVAGAAATAALIKALKDPSDLFRHDVAFCLGQRQDPAAVDTLKALVADTQQHPMVRHEAAEALGAIAAPDCLELLQQHASDTCQELAETCQLALGRLAYLREKEAAAAAAANASAAIKAGPAAAEAAPAAAEAASAAAADVDTASAPEAAEAAAGDGESPYYSVDPTPALPASTPIQELRSILLDAQQPMFERYRALFALRNKGGQEAVSVLGEAFGASSALLKHEVAYVMGQMQHPASAGVLCKVLQDTAEHAMVRHEAAEALGAVADAASVALLKQYACDPDPIVAHSCVVALDMLEHEASGAFEYADTAATA